jgi:hypothetical protein
VSAPRGQDTGPGSWCLAPRSCRGHAGSLSSWLAAQKPCSLIFSFFVILVCEVCRAARGTVSPLGQVQQGAKQHVCATPSHACPPCDPP